MSKITAKTLPVAIIGAGVSGLVVAQALRDRGHSVKVLDKGRGPGGRISTRRHDELRFDHGAQYFTARDPVFRREVEAWVEHGAAELWQGRIVAIEHGRIGPEKRSHERFVGVPGMNAIARHLTTGLDISYATRVEKIERVGEAWQLSARGENLGLYSAVVVTAPPAQAAELLVVAPHLSQQARDVAMRPCWALMTVFDEPLEVPFDGAFVNDSPLSWIARDSSKPGRPGVESWVLHGSPEWSRDHLEVSPDEARDELLAALFAAVGLPPRVPRFALAHRWRYSIAVSPLEVGCLWDADLGIGACGDWCSGSRVEGAFLSGRAIANQVASAWR